MATVTEIEMRGLIQESDLETLKIKLKEMAVLKEIKNRVLIDYTTLIDGQKIEDRTTDIRIRNTNGVSEIIVKTGKWGGSDARKEFKVKTEGSFDSLVQVMSLLGYTKGVLCVRNSEVYQLGEVEIAIVKVPNHSCYFEAEIETDTSHDVGVLSKEILEAIASFGLQAFSDDEFYNYIKQLNAEANTIFNADVESEEYFKNRFNI